ncbi:MAG: hypothetical protein IJV64_09040, partial [Oscillospiraceae bacterium]|nr:hypothetical protein [Oscillospiraceae bacterium]
LFLSDWDRLEDHRTALSDPLAAADVEALMERPAGDTAGAYGRLVLGRDWYFAALAPAGAALTEGQRCLLRFDGIDRLFPARLLRLGAEEDGPRALLLRLTEETEDCLSLRKCGARLFLPGAESELLQEKEG